MLKRYATTEQIRWVGKAWEIRHALRQEMKRLGADARLADLLPPANSRKITVPLTVTSLKSTVNK